MLTQHCPSQGASIANWNSPQGTQDLFCDANKAPSGDTQGFLFQRMVEGATTQATQAVALIAPEEIVRKLEEQKRRRQPSVLLARKKAKKGMLNNALLSRFGGQPSKRQKQRLSQKESSVTKETRLAESLKNIFGRFCGLIVNSERDLSTLEKELTHMTQKDSAWHPAQLYLVQVRVSHLSQKVEFFTSLMNKALESSKQIMNTQI
ncbi:hypothetical protein [Candidatus Similichlamydia epinepheli]|uniref:hypothetical protein n=1 Tax=Candidatus Similichlamydia epinepheli TaxID=1903953 RepID=UPI000D3A0742|nr:hypothetical protein [Candidatus Similichlamydia epinepheli]